MDPSLRRYTPDQVVEAAAALRLRLASGLIVPPEVERLLTLRAADGTDWAHGLRSGRWYAHTSDAWIPRRPAPPSLEGLSGLATLLRLGPRPPTEAPPPSSPQDGPAPTASQIPSPPSPHEAAVTPLADNAPSPPSASLALLEWLHAVYDAGSLATSEVAPLLDDLVLLDSQGSLWAPGFQTRRWYQLTQSHWRVPETDPGAGAGLQGREPPPEAAAQALGRLEDASPRFPEPITPAWSPPPGYPERLACPRCGSPLLTAAETCPVCRDPAPLAPQHGGEEATAAAASATFPEPAPEPTSWSLTIVEGAAAGRTYRMRGGEHIGRGSGNEISIEDPKASARHARIERVGHVLRVLDLGSTNGTILNGAGVTQSAPLKPGDRIRIGATVLEVRGPDQCAYCGAPIAQEDWFCGECGTPAAPAGLPAPRPSPASPYPGVPPAPFPAYGARPRSRRFTWSGIGLGCLLILLLLGGTAVCLVAISFLSQS